jgi:hypothetical protein
LIKNEAMQGEQPPPLLGMPTSDRAAEVAVNDAADNASRPLLLPRPDAPSSSSLPVAPPAPPAAGPQGRRRSSTLLTVCPFILGNEFCERLAFYG